MTTILSVHSVRLRSRPGAGNCVFSRPPSQKSGIALGTLTGLAVLLQPQTAAAGLQYLIERNGGTPSPMISLLATFLPTLARRIEMPEEAIAKLRKIAAKLKVTQRGMTPRNREALRPFDDEAAVKALVTLPARLAEEVLRSGRKGYREAKMIQTALAIELLLNAPVRIKNLASIELTRHLLEVGSRRDRRVHLRFPAHEVKNANDLEFPLMPETVDLLELYLKVWRPILCCGEEAPFLFPGDRPDRPKGNSTLSSQIKELVFAYTRLEMPAHRFRHVAAKIYLDRNPGQYEVIRQLLGHKDIETTIAFYAGAETASAARHYARTILGIRLDPARRAGIGQPLMPRLCLPVSEWPASDRKAWEAAHQHGGLLDDDGLAAKLGAGHE
jgi:integrase